MNNTMTAGQTWVGQNGDEVIIDGVTNGEPSIQTVYYITPNGATIGVNRAYFESIFTLKDVEPSDVMGSSGWGNPLDSIIAEDFVNLVDSVAEYAHETAKSKGWWDNRHKLMEIVESYAPELSPFTRSTLDLASICLMHSELSEATESIRNGNAMDDKIPQYRGDTAEMADTIIRILDHTAENGQPLAETIIAKMRFNGDRSYMHGGKTL